MKTDASGRRLPTWIRLYTSTFTLVNAATLEQAGEALKSAVNHIQTGEEPDIADGLTACLYELLMDGAEYSITEYAKKIEGGKLGAAITNSRRAAGEPQESRAYLREGESEEKKEGDRSRQPQPVSIGFTNTGNRKKQSPKYAKMLTREYDFNALETAILAGGTKKELEA